MGFNIAHCARIDPCLAIGRNQEVSLCSGVGSCERTGTSSMVFATANDHPINMVSILLSLSEPFQDKHADPFSSHITIGLSREGFASSIWREHSRFARTDVQFGGDQGIDTAYDGHATLSILNGLHPPVNGNQGTGAGCINRLARSVQVEKITHAVGSHRWGQTNDCIALHRHRRTKYSFTIATAGCSHK